MCRHKYGVGVGAQHVCIHINMRVLEWYVCTWGECTPLAQPQGLCGKDPRQGP